MPIHHAIWQVGEKPTPLQTSKLAAEEQLRGLIIQDPRILSNDWMIIGREVPTPTLTNPTPGLYATEGILAS